MPGPAPKDPSARRRRNAAVGVTLLPAKGREGKSPLWPLPNRECPENWDDLWRLPQAVAWEQIAAERVVARYALLLDEFENTADMPVTRMQEIRHLEDRLGMNPKAMRALLWRVTEDEVAEQRATSRASKATTKRRALKIVG